LIDEIYKPILKAILSMRHWFLSYTSQDFALTQRLKDALKCKDPDSEIFFAPESMRAGGFWKPQLAKEIEESTAFILLVGEKLGDWQVIEYYEALDRRAKEPDYPIVFIMSAKRPTPGLPFARQLHWVISEDPASEATVGKLMQAVSGPAQRPPELWRFTRPYRGLEAMTEANTDYFYGRNTETATVLSALAEKRGRCPILVGASGVGKSSVARAGVLSALKSMQWPGTERMAASTWPAGLTNSRGWLSLAVRPGESPLEALAAAFIQLWQFDAQDVNRRAFKQHATDRTLPPGSPRRAFYDVLKSGRKPVARLRGEKTVALRIYRRMTAWGQNLRLPQCNIGIRFTQ
jgi:hypothetical protein